MSDIVQCHVIVQWSVKSIEVRSFWLRWEAAEIWMRLVGDLFRSESTYIKIKEANETQARKYKYKQSGIWNTVYEAMSQVFYSTSLRSNGNLEVLGFLMYTIWRGFIWYHWYTRLSANLLITNLKFLNGQVLVWFGLATISIIFLFFVDFSFIQLRKSPIPTTTK